MVMISAWCIAAASAAVSHSDPCADAAAWAGRCSRVPALAVESRLVEPLAGREGPNGTIEVRRTLSWGWPPRLRIDQELRASPSVMPAAKAGVPVANPPRLSAFWATPGGEVVDVQRGFNGRGGSFTRSSFEPTRKAAIVDAWTESPVLLGRMIFEETAGAPERFTLTEEGVRVTVAGVPVILRLNGEDKLVRLQYARPTGGAITAEYRTFTPLPAAVAGGSGGVMMPGEVRWSLSDAMVPGAAVESGDRVRTVGLKVGAAPGAEAFVPDLSGLTTKDPLTGEVKDAAGTVLVVLPPRAMAWSWAWLVLAGGLGMGVAGAGVWVWRGRVA